MKKKLDLYAPKNQFNKILSRVEILLRSTGNFWY